MQVLIRKARIVDSQSEHNGKVVDILVDDGVISRIAASIRTDADLVIEHKDLHVSPGWVDVFADYREPGYEHKETIETGIAAAAAGGFTDVLLAPNTQPALSTKSAVQFIKTKAAGKAVNVHPYGTATRNAEGKELAEMMDMRAHGAVAFTDGWKPVQNANLLLKALEYVTAIDGVVVQLPVDASLSSGGLMHEGPVSTSLGMAGIPALAETLAVHRDIELARYTGGKLHITGISSAASVDMVRKAKKDGVQITCSVTPYHLALTDEALRGYDSVYKLVPPLRSEADRKALVAGLKDGTIDCIATHHAPHEWDAKAKEFEYAADGMAVQETAFAAMWAAIEKQVGIEKLVAALTATPRAIFGLPAATVTKGQQACFTLFSPTATTNVTNESKKTLGVNNPFAGKALAGAVLGIINNRQVKLN
ncbi:MAG: dihydroorotase [Taibaiella sp.]|nr:dihydroorotase [Taibaiella sp.]